MKKLSVIVPVYNAEKYINRCANSILNQTYFNLELLLVNDGSKDNSLELCYEIAKKDNRVRVFDKPNGGAASARNLGIQNVIGEYVGFCDADDYLDLNMYEELINELEKNDLPTIECTAKVYDENDSLLLSDPDDRSLKIVEMETALKEIYLRKGNVSLATRVVKAEYLKDLIIPEGKRVEDFYFTICLLTKTKKTAIYSFPFYNCVTSSGSVTRSKGGSIYFDAIYFYEKSNNYLKPYNLDLGAEQEYYLLKMYYLLSISLTFKEIRDNKALVKKYKKDLQSKIKLVKNNNYLRKKEKLMLKFASISFKLSRLLFLLKNKGNK